MNKTIESRICSNKIARCELRMDEAEPKQPKAIEGYAAVFYRADEPGSQYWLWDDFVERIQPGAFDRAIKEQHDARADFNHNADLLLGRVSAGTLTLSVDDVGLRFSVPFDATDADHVRVASKIRRGDVTGCSFEFYSAASAWEDIRDDDDSEKIISVRNITDLNLVAVGPVAYPAYEATEVGVRTAVRDRAALTEARSAAAVYRESIALQRRQDQAVELQMRMREIEQAR